MAAVQLRPSTRRICKTVGVAETQLRTVSPAKECNTLHREVTPNVQPGFEILPNILFTGMVLPMQGTGALEHGKSTPGNTTY